jgi:hypothetical protein
MIGMNNDIVGACQKVSKPKAIAYIIAYIVTAGILLHPRHFRFPRFPKKMRAESLSQSLKFHAQGVRGGKTSPPNKETLF